MKISTLPLLLITCFSISFLTVSAITPPFGPKNIVLKSFSGTTDGRTAKLAWDLGQMENEVTCFLERSEDGIQFTAIASFVISKGFSGVMSATDKQVTIGLYYYRLYIAKTGFIPYVSNVISIKINKGEEPISEYKVENPFRQQLTIKGNFSSNPLVVEIADLNGRVQVVKSFIAASNRKTISIPGSNLVNGVYVLRIREERNGIKEVVLTRRIIKNGD